MTALVRGAFEYSGQKCSAASRAYLPRSLWDAVRDDLVARTEALPVGDVRDFANFTSAVIDRRSFDRLSGVLDALASDPAARSSAMIDPVSAYFEPLSTRASVSSNWSSG